MEALLQNVRLKKTVPVVDSASAATAVAQEREQQRRLRECDIEEWVEGLKSHTMKTELVALSPAEARALQLRFRRKETAESRQCLHELELRVAQCLEQCFSAPQGVFVKLSSRSPKDSTLVQQRALETVKRELLRRRHELNVDVVAEVIMQSTIDALRNNTAQDVIHVLASSDRVCEDDIPLALSFEEKGQWTQHVVLREWMQAPIRYEVRVFVVGRKLTAATQYYVPLYVPELIERNLEVASILNEMFEQIRWSCPLADYSMDVAVNLTAKKATVIEINPFGPPDCLGTGTVLFSSKNSSDLKILFGQSPFEFRVQLEPTDTPMESFVSGPLKQWMSEQGMI